MCLAVPGRILDVSTDEPLLRMVLFGGIEKEVCLAYLPQAARGEVPPATDPSAG